MLRSALILGFAALFLTGCEPLRGIVSEKDIQTPLDISCVGEALSRTFGEIERWDYDSDGSNFPQYTRVAQFGYYHSEDFAGWAKLEIGKVGREFRIVHSFTGIGSELPQNSFPPAMAAMQKARQVLRSECGVDLSDMELRAVGQTVDALN